MTVDLPSENDVQRRGDDCQTSLDSFVALTRDDCRETIEFLIDHRKLLRDEELARLEEESQAASDD